jgi:hypothetical protein
LRRNKGEESMSGASSRRLRLACLTAVSALAIGASGVGFPPVRNLDLALGEHGRLTIGAVRTGASLLGVAAAQVPGLQQGLDRALQGVGGAETVTLDNVVLDLGFATYRMPKVEVSGSSLSRAELMGLFDRNAGDLPARLARFSAKQVRIPELVVEQTFANQRQVTRYRAIAVDGVAQGRVAAASSEGASFEMKGGAGAGAGTMGRLTLTDVDLPETVRVYSERAASPGPMKKLYAGFTLENLAVTTEDGPQFKVARVAGRDFSARPTKDSWTETMKAFTVAEGLDKATPAEQSRVFGAVADVFDSMEVGLVEATGIDIVNPKGKDKGAGGIARVAYSGGAGKPADLRMERLELAADQGKAKIDLIAFTGFSFTSTFRALRDLEGKPAKDLDMATLRQLIPTIGTIRISGMDFDMPDDDKKGPAAENIRFSLKDMEVTADRPLNGIPTNLRAGMDGFRMPIPPGTTEEGLKDLAAMGYKELDLSWATAAAWNAPTNELLVREVSVRGAGMGSTSLRATFGGVTRDAFSPDNALAMVTLLGATVRNADLTIENGGLLEKLLAREAGKQKKSVDDLRKEFGMAAAIAVPAMLGNSGQAKAIGQAVARFVAKPGKLSISARTKDPAGLGLADLTAIGEPGAILDKLEVTAAAE